MLFIKVFLISSYRYLENKDIIMLNMELHLQAFTSDSLKSKLHELCDFEPKYYDFPGSIPVSLSRNDVKYLHKNYCVCDKTDGSRYMCLCTNNQIYFVDRLMNFYYFGSNEIDDNDYVYDGELVKNKVNDKYVFVIFDVFASGGKVLKSIPNHYKRIQNVIGLLPQVIQNVEFRMKSFFFTFNLKKCLNQNLPYETDGLIFTPMYRKIFNGTDKRTYKWKDGVNHTIDFEVVNNYIYLWDKNNEKIKICKVEEETFIDYSVTPCIVECKIGILNEETIWTIIKQRKDKARPNSMKTYLSTIEVIKENITIDYLNNNLCIN